MKVERKNKEPKFVYMAETMVGACYTPHPIINGIPVFIRTSVGFVNLETGTLVREKQAAIAWRKLEAKVVVS